MINGARGVTMIHPLWTWPIVHVNSVIIVLKRHMANLLHCPCVVQEGVILGQSSHIETDRMMEGLVSGVPDMNLFTHVPGTQLGVLPILM